LFSVVYFLCVLLPTWRINVFIKINMIAVKSKTFIICHLHLKWLRLTYVYVSVMAQMGRRRQVPVSWYTVPHRAVCTQLVARHGLTVPPVSRRVVMINVELLVNRSTMYDDRTSFHSLSSAGDRCQSCSFGFFCGRKKVIIFPALANFGPKSGEFCENGVECDGVSVLYTQKTHYYAKPGVFVFLLDSDCDSMTHYVTQWSRNAVVEVVCTLWEKRHSVWRVWEMRLFVVIFIATFCVCIVTDDWLKLNLRYM